MIKTQNTSRFYSMTPVTIKFLPFLVVSFYATCCMSAQSHFSSHTTNEMIDFEANKDNFSVEITDENGFKKNISIPIPSNLSNYIVKQSRIKKKNYTWDFPTSFYVNRCKFHIGNQEYTWYGFSKMIDKDGNCFEVAPMFNLNNLKNKSSFSQIRKYMEPTPRHIKTKQFNETLLEKEYSKLVMYWSMECSGTIQCN